MGGGGGGGGGVGGVVYLFDIYKHQKCIMIICLNAEFSVISIGREPFVRQLLG